jgi:hypothetical protein
LPFQNSFQYYNMDLNGMIGTREIYSHPMSSQDIEETQLQQSETTSGDRWQWVNV